MQVHTHKSLSSRRIRTETEMQGQVGSNCVDAQKCERRWAVISSSEVNRQFEPDTQQHVITPPQVDRRQCPAEKPMHVRPPSPGQSLCHHNHQLWHLRARINCTYWVQLHLGKTRFTLSTDINSSRTLMCTGELYEVNLHFGKKKEKLLQHKYAPYLQW